jgi:hypothetical protein
MSTALKKGVSFFNERVFHKLHIFKGKGAGLLAAPTVVSWEGLDQELLAGHSGCQH